MSLFESTITIKLQKSIFQVPQGSSALYGPRRFSLEGKLQRGSVRHNLFAKQKLPIDVNTMTVIHENLVSVERSFQEF